MKLKDLEINIIKLSDKYSNIFFVFTSDSSLYLYDKNNDEAKKIFKFENIKTDYNKHREEDIYKTDYYNQIEIRVFYPYVSVTERFGLNSAVYNMESSKVIYLKREDYHSEICSYSSAFIKLFGKAVFITQTLWNRLDFVDLETGEIITKREVFYGTKENDYKDSKNYLDYFHSLIHVSPNYQYFLSNGWVWQPFDYILCFEVSEFLKVFELCPYRYTINDEFTSGYNWDRPLSFIENKKFVVALDKADDFESDDDKLEYRQLYFYDLSSLKNLDSNGLEAYKKLDINMFDVADYGEVKGYMYFSKTYNILIAVSPLFIRFLNLNDSHSNELKQINIDENDIYDFSEEFNFLYCFRDGSIKEIYIKDIFNQH